MEPSLPHVPIGLLHVTGRTKTDVFEIRTLSGATHRSPLDYGSFRRLRSTVMAADG